MMDEESEEIQMKISKLDELFVRAPNITRLPDCNECSQLSKTNFCSVHVHRYDNKTWGKHLFLP